MKKGPFKHSTLRCLERIIPSFSEFNCTVWASMFFNHVRAPWWADVLCRKCIFYCEQLVQIQEGGIINERNRVQQGEESPRKGLLKKTSEGEEGIGQMSASWELFLISQAESCALSPGNTHAGPFLNCSPSTPMTHLFSFLFYSTPHSLLPASQCSLSLTFLLSHLFSRSNLPF